MKYFVVILCVRLHVPISPPRARPEVKVISANPKHYEKNPLARAQHDISDLEKLQHIKEWKEREKKTWVRRGFHDNFMQCTSCQIRKIVGCASAGIAGNVFSSTVGWRSQHASRHVHDKRAVVHAGIAT